MVLDTRTLQSTPESGRAGRAATPRTKARLWDPGLGAAKQRKGSKMHIAIDTLGHLPALKVTPADEGDRTQVAVPAEQVQEATGRKVESPYVDQGYTGSASAEAAQQRASSSK